MKAIVCHKYGSPDVLQLQELARPALKEDKVLVRVHAASLNAADFETLRGVGELVKRCRLFYGGSFRPHPRVTRIIGHVR